MKTMKERFLLWWDQDLVNSYRGSTFSGPCPADKEWFDAKTWGHKIETCKVKKEQENEN